MASGAVRRPTARRVLAWASAAGLVAFALLTLDELFHGVLYNLDFRADAAMTRWAAAWPTVHAVGNVFSQPGSGLSATAAVAGCAVLLACWGQWRRAAALVAGSLAGGLAVNVLKPAIGRPLPDFLRLSRVSFAHGYGFPSGHTIGATVSLGLCFILVAEAWIARKALASRAAARLRRQALAAWVSMALIVGIARVLAQHHWVSDVLGAWSLGVALLCATLLAAGEWRGAGPFFRSRPVPTPMRFVGFTGMPGSGKSEAMEVARAAGIPVVRMGDLIWDEVERQGKPRDAKHVGEVANAMRASDGKDVWAIRTVERVREVVAQAEDRPAAAARSGQADAPRSARLVLIDGIRSNDEVETFRRELGSDFVLVAIHTDPEHRFGRMVRRARADDSDDPAVLKARDEREMNWGIARTIALADEMVVNDATLDEFRSKVRVLLERTRPS
ncbi:MAG: phosphatase PAP2 family protein [Thermoplasmatota archaeon]